jgi:hypothetical protein
VIWVPVTGWIWFLKSADKNTPKQSWGSQVPLITQAPKTKISYPKHTPENKQTGLLGGSNLGTNSVLVPKMIPHPSKTHNLGPRKSFDTQSTNNTQKPSYDQKTHPRHPKKRFSQKTRSNILPSVVTLMVAISGKTYFFPSEFSHLAATLFP